MSCRTTSWHTSVPRRPYAQILCLLVLSCMGLAPAATPGSPTPQPTVHPRSWPPAASPAALTDSATEATVQALLAQLSLEEKVGQTIQADINSITPDDLKRYPLGSIEAGGNSSPGHDERAPAPAWVALLREFRAANQSYWGNRRAVPIIFGIDAVHGHSNIVGATIFPHNVGLGAAGDATLIRRIGEITALEVAATGADWTYAPTVTVPRDDRWGRSYEGYSSEPRIVAQYAREITLGLQGVLPLQGPIKPGRIVGTAKHFLADGGTENGQDQGDAKISEGELIRIHAAGYPPAIDAGVMTVMTSFSSWNGVKHAGNRSLITDVLKGRMGFMGFVIDDWNAHGQIPGCSNDSCPEAMNAGIDMYMAPSDWKSLYVNLIQQVRSGVIAQARLDDAVRRILRVKVKAGLLRAERPLEGRYELLGAQAHRAVARQAVRESLVLLKNDQVLPIRGDAHVLVTGDGADDIGKQCGGWTISWQGTGNTNADFPHGQSIFAGIAQALSAGGGNAVLSPDGSFTTKPDVAIVVFGEDPYAEFQGDLPTLHYKPGDDRDLNLLRRLKSQGVRTVAVFLSGRPLWVNREINASDAFVAAWLPGTEGGGIADVLVGDAHGKARFDFRGRLARNWPRHPTRASLQLDEPSDPLFAYGYGLSYATPALLSKLDEGGAVLSRSGGDVFFDAGRFQEGTRAVLHDVGGERPAEAGAETVSPHGALTMHAADADAQENARELRWSGAEPASLDLTGPRRDLSRQSNGDMAIALLYHLLEAPSKTVSLGMACGEGCRGRVDITPYLRSATVNKPQTMKIKLSCLAHQGIDMTRVDEPLVLETSGALRLLVRKVWLTSNEGDAICPSGVH